MRDLVDVTVEPRWAEESVYDEAFGPPDPHRLRRIDEWGDHWSIREAIEICERDHARWVRAREAEPTPRYAVASAVEANRRWCEERDRGMHPPPSFCNKIETGYMPSSRWTPTCDGSPPMRLWDAIPTTCWWNGSLKGSRPGHLRVSVRHPNGAQHRVFVPIPHYFERGDDWLRLTDPESGAFHAQFVDVETVAIATPFGYTVRRAS